MKITIKDIAKMAGVSISTVSRVINDSKPVNEDIKKRVLDAINQTNYHSKTINNALIKNDSCIIGVIIPEYSNTVLSNFIDGINKVAKLYGFDIIINLTDGTVENEVHYLKLLRTIQAQGIIFVGSPLNKEHIKIIEESNTPCVLAGQISETPSIPSVHVDNITASYEAVTYLIQKGHRDIAMIRGSGTMAVGADRFQGYLQALTHAGITIREDWVVESGFSVEDGIEAMRKITKTESMPTAIFCATDWMAIGAMNYLIDNGFRIPQDISIFGFDGSSMSTVVRPKLSTVEYSATEMGMTSARNLFKIMKGETPPPAHYNVIHHLAIRESTN